MKKIVSGILICVMILTCACVSAISSDDAIAYYDIVENLYSRGIGSASSFLIDFDDDGRDELLIFWGSDWEKLYPTDRGDYKYYNYEVYSGGQLIGSSKENMWFDFYISTKQGEGNRKYFVKRLHNEYNGDLTSFTVKNGEWVIQDEYSFVESGGEDGLVESTINGVKGTVGDYYEKASEYSYSIDLKNNTSNVKEQLVDSMDITVSGYTDIYSKLSSSEKKMIFDDFLYDAAFLGEYDSLKNFNSRDTSDEEIVFMLECLRMDTDFPIKENPFTVQEFDEITKRYFGRTIDYTKFEADHKPTSMDYGYANLYYDGMFYLCEPQRGSMEGVADKAKETHLYDLGGDKYYASYRMTVSDYEFDYVSDIIGSAVVTKNDDGTYKLDRIGGLMSKAELDAMVNPSDWAKAELAKAEQAGLVPELDGTPFMTENATRLQFAQLAVNLAEKVTGKKLTAASDTTFTDCKDTAVLKAYKAGIINGVSDDKFAPYDKLTREQLATMIWRTVDYIQSKAKEEKLTSGGTLSGYTDAAEVSDYAKDAVAALAKHEIMKGTSETELSPKGNCTVEQSVILVYRTYMKIK